MTQPNDCLLVEKLIKSNIELRDKIAHRDSVPAAERTPLGSYVRFLQADKALFIEGVEWKFRPTLGYYELRIAPHVIEDKAYKPESLKAEMKGLGYTWKRLGSGKNRYYSFVRKFK